MNESNFTHDLLTGPEPPVLLFYMMGVWACITGITGFIANVVAILLFLVSKKVTEKCHLVFKQVQNK